MKKYLVLYHSEAALSGVSTAEMFAQTTPEQLAAGMAAWRAWQEKCSSALTDAGAPVDKSTTVAGGSTAPSKTSITGYTLLQANSIEDAVALMKDHPHFRAPSASVQVLECVSLPGM
jgi:hypothetical protein